VYERLAGTVLEYTALNAGGLFVDLRSINAVTQRYDVNHVIDVIYDFLPSRN
jgi:hypothetical protein